MPTTTKMGIVYPASTDLVKNGATAMGTISTTVDAKTGLVLLNSTSFSAVASQSINDVFSANFDEYLIQVTAKASASNACLFRLRASGSDASNATYNVQYLTASSTTVSGSRSNSQTSFDASDLDTSEKTNTLIVSNPFASGVITSFFLNAPSWVADNNSNPSVNMHAGSFTTTGTSYTGFSLIMGGGTMTGSVKVYGYNK